MRSTARPRARPLDDLTARARIRDAALELFAEHGVNGTSIRGVADKAGVSPGLVQHHFGTKEGLREACDTHVIETLLAQARQGVEGEGVDADILSSMYEASQPGLRYIARALVEGSPGAAKLFDKGTAVTEKWLTTTWPERFPAGSQKVRERAATMAAMHLGTIVLHAHLSRCMGADPLERTNQHRISASMLDIYSCMSDFLASKVGGQLQDALAEYQRKSSSPPKDKSDD